jgi:hypothetical protein
MRVVVLAAVISFLAGPGYASGPCAVAEAKAVTAAIAGGIQNGIEAARNLKEACDAGEVISLPANSVYVISEVCDFSKSVYQSPNGKTVCVVKK